MGAQRNREKGRVTAEITQREEKRLGEKTGEIVFVCVCPGKAELGNTGVSLYNIYCLQIIK